MVNRRTTIYAQLPEGMFKPNQSEAKLSVSLNLVMPKELAGTKKTDELMADLMNACEKEFNSFIKKRLKKMNEEKK